MFGFVGERRKSHAKEIIVSHVYDDMLSVLHCDLLVLLLSVEQIKFMQKSSELMYLKIPLMNTITTHTSDQRY
jgi:hypothetical protein